jgi:hypothetical protein
MTIAVVEDVSRVNRAIDALREATVKRDYLLKRATLARTLDAVQDADTACRVVLSLRSWLRERRPEDGRFAPEGARGFRALVANDEALLKLHDRAVPTMQRRTPPDISTLIA